MRGGRLLVIALAALQGCVPLLPRPESGSRTNLPETVPAFIRIGESTRADVMLGLGEPEASAVNDSWVMYASRYSKGGVLVIGNGTGGGAIERMRYQRLIVRFDADGIVMHTLAESANCWVSSNSRNDPLLTIEPCLDASGRDIPGKYGLAPLRD